MTNDKTFTLIQQLHALATGKGATEAEAQTALEKMQKLLFRHNLELSAVLSARPEERSGPEYTQSEESVLKGKYGMYASTVYRGLPQSEREWRVKLAASIARYNFCRVLKDRQFTKVWFYGTAENIAAVKDIWAYVVEQVHDLSYSELKVFHQAGFRQNGRSWRKEFLDGICSRVGERLREQFETLTAENERSTALVLYNDKALTTLVEKFQSKGPGTAYTRHARGLGYEMGKSAGDLVNLGTRPQQLGPGTLQIQ